jgi:hypothetical protein
MNIVSMPSKFKKTIPLYSMNKIIMKVLWEIVTGSFKSILIVTSILSMVFLSSLMICLNQTASYIWQHSMDSNYII